eukprot:7685260-Pyramimonas_sp.AAC.1
MLTEWAEIWLIEYRNIPKNWPSPEKYDNNTGHCGRPSSLKLANHTAPQLTPQAAERRENIACRKTERGSRSKGSTD